MTGQNTTNDNELSLGLLRQRRILILISIILPLFIYGIVSIENIEMLSGINIDVEQLYIKYILVVLLVYFWVRYWQYEKVDAKRINLVEQMKKKIKVAREKFFKKIVCPSIKDCFGLEYCCILEEEKDLPKSKNNNLLCREKNIGIISVPPKYECHYTGVNIENMTDAIKAEIKEIELKGWSKAEKDFKVHEDSNINGKPLATKTFPYSPLELEFFLWLAKVKFYFTSAYFTDYLLPYYLAAIAFFVFIADLCAFPDYIAVLLAIILVALKNSKYCQKIQRKTNQRLNANECAKKYLALCAK